MPTIRLSGAGKHYSNTNDRPALEHVDLAIGQGEYVSITGPSGGGKSTLLNVLGLLDHVDEGTYLIDDVDVATLSERQRAAIRSEAFGFVFQNFYLLDRRPANRSVELSLLYRAVPRHDRRSRSDTALTAVGLEDASSQIANTLSGGQRQRVAIARVLASSAPIVLADEPTGNLDTHNGEAVIRELERLNRNGATLILVTHDPALAVRAPRQLTVIDGHLREAAAVRARAVTTPLLEGTFPRSSRFRFIDAVRDARESLLSRPTRSLSLVAAVALGIGLSIATVGLSLSAGAQVSADFDAHVNRDVSVEWVSEAKDENLPSEAERLDALAALKGVDAVGILENLSNHDALISPVRATFSFNCYGYSGDLLTAARVSTRWARSFDSEQIEPGQAIIGKSLADKVELGPLDAPPTILIDGRRFTVVGILTASPRIPELLGGFLVLRGSLPVNASAPTTTALLLTSPGAAQQVARQAPLVIDPYHPDDLEVTAPVDPAQLRAEVESSVSVALTLLTIVALGGAIAGLSNSMLLSVAERRQEIGLRSALGGRPIHAALLFMLESVIVGLLGGLFGLVLGLLAVLLATIVMGWSPLFDFRLAIVALVGGMVVGAGAGIIASARAARISPADALRL